MNIENIPNRRFVVRLENNEEAYLEYNREGDVLDFQYIYVPPSARGTGLAGRILKHAFDYAREQNCKVIPTCSYIAGTFLPRFKEYHDLIAR